VGSCKFIEWQADAQSAYLPKPHAHNAHGLDISGVLRAKRKVAFCRTRAGNPKPLYATVQRNLYLDGRVSDGTEAMFSLQKRVFA
jgi:hypothetical protein